MRSLPPTLLAAAAVLVVTLAPRAQETRPRAAPASIGYGDLLRATVDFDRLWQRPQNGERCVQFSSYDRRSDVGPGGGEAWWANADTGHFLRVEETASGHREHVMVDCRGPGTVVRIWSADPKGRLRFYVDGATTPTWEVEFAALTSGTLPPFLEPLAGVRARGHNCHVPFPFREHLKVTCDAPKLYYHVNVRLWPRGTVVESFAPALLERHRAAIDALRAELERRLDASTHSDLGEDHFDWSAVNWMSADAESRAATRVTILDREGPVVVEEWFVQPVLPQPGCSVSARDLLRAQTIVVTVDGHETVRVPVADFFGAAPDLKPYRSLALGVRDDGTCYSRWPIPAREHVTIVLEVPERPLATGGTTFGARVVPRDVAAGALTFHASWHLRRDVPTRPFSDHLVLDASGGPGRFVGCALSVCNPVKAWWGEGDERIRVDGEPFPSTFGTGTEDYFGYAWCCNDPFASAFHAQPQCDGPANFGYTAVNRCQLADAVPFQRTLRFEFEVWHWNPRCTVDYATTAYWYAPAAAAGGLPPLPPPEQRRARVLQPSYRLSVKDALEGEALRVAGRTRGRTQKQDCGGFEGGVWSGDEQLWWTGARPGDRLTLELPVPAAGRYRVCAVFTKANDYAIVQPHLNGQPLGAPIDLYHASVVPSERLELGTLALPAGAVPFTLEIVGRNERAIPQFMAGLDYVLLQRVE